MNTGAVPFLGFPLAAAVLDEDRLRPALRVILFWDRGTSMETVSRPDLESRKPSPLDLEVGGGEEGVPVESGGVDADRLVYRSKIYHEVERGKGKA